MSDNNIKIKVLIADSSNPEDLKANIQFINKIETKLHVDHHIFDSKISLSEKYRLVLPDINTPFVVICADDDFLVPSSLKKAVEFLKVNPHYSVAQGYAASFELRDSLVHGEIKTLNCNTQRSIEHISAAERLVDHLRHYSLTYYSVHRTDQIWRIFEKRAEFDKKTELLIPHFRFRELLTSCLSVIQGKAKKLDCLLMVQQSHPMSVSHKQKSYSLWEWIAVPGWSDEYKKFRYCLAEELARQDGISMAEAKYIVKYAFWLYVALNRFNPQEQNDQLTLPALLRRSSPFHEDFMPIYRAITTTPPSTEIESFPVIDPPTAMLYR